MKKVRPCQYFLAPLQLFSSLCLFLYVFCPIFNVPVDSQCGFFELKNYIKKTPRIHHFRSKIRPRAACARTGRLDVGRDVCLFGCTLPLHFTQLSFWMQLTLHFTRLQYFFFILVKSQKARELPAHFSSKWDYFSAPFFDVFSPFLGIDFLTLFGPLFC